MLATISDKKFGVSSAGSSLIDHYEPDIITAQDYYPFGMLSREALPNSGVPYKFGFNGKLNDNDVKGGLGLQQDYGMRIYDGRVGRFLSVDPITRNYPMLTPYQFASNRPIDGVDQDGLEYSAITNWLADKAKANGYPRLGGFVRSLGAGDVQTQTQDLINNVAKGKLTEVAVQVYGYTGTGMFENSVKLAKKAVIDQDPEAQGEALGFLVQGAFGEIVARARPAAPRVSTEPVDPMMAKMSKAEKALPSMSKSYDIFEGTSRDLIKNAEFEGKISVEDGVLSVKIKYIEKLDTKQPEYSTYNNFIEKVESIAKEHNVKEIKITGHPFKARKAEVPFKEAGYTTTQDKPDWDYPTLTRTKTLK